MRLRTALCGELVVWFSLIKAIIQSSELFASVFLSRIPPSRKAMADKYTDYADFVLATKRHPPSLKLRRIGSGTKKISHRERRAGATVLSF